MPIGRTPAHRLALKIHASCERTLSNYASYSRMTKPRGPTDDDAYIFSIISKAIPVGRYGMSEQVAYVRVYPDLSVQFDPDERFPRELLDCVIHYEDVRR